MNIDTSDLEKLVEAYSRLSAYVNSGDFISAYRYIMGDPSIRGMVSDELLEKIRKGAIAQAINDVISGGSPEEYRDVLNGYYTMMSAVDRGDYVTAYRSFSDPYSLLTEDFKDALKKSAEAQAIKNILTGDSPDKYSDILEKPVYDFLKAYKAGDYATAYKVLEANASVLSNYFDIDKTKEAVLKAAVAHAINTYIDTGKVPPEYYDVMPEPVKEIMKKLEEGDYESAYSFLQSNKGSLAEYIDVDSLARSLANAVFVTKANNIIEKLSKMEIDPQEALKKIRELARKYGVEAGEIIESITEAVSKIEEAKKAKEIVEKIGEAIGKKEYEEASRLIEANLPLLSSYIEPDELRKLDAVVKLGELITSIRKADDVKRVVDFVESHKDVLAGVTNVDELLNSLIQIYASLRITEDPSSVEDVAKEYGDKVKVKVMTDDGEKTVTLKELYEASKKATEAWDKIREILSRESLSVNDLYGAYNILDSYRDSLKLVGAYSALKRMVEAYGKYLEGMSQFEQELESGNFDVAIARIKSLMSDEDVKEFFGDQLEKALSVAEAMKRIGFYLDNDPKKVLAVFGVFGEPPRDKVTETIVNMLSSLPKDVVRKIVSIAATRYLFRKENGKMVLKVSPEEAIAVANAMYSMGYGDSWRKLVDTIRGYLSLKDEIDEINSLSNKLIEKIGAAVTQFNTAMSSISDNPRYALSVIPYLENIAKEANQLVSTLESKIVKAKSDAKGNDEIIRKLEYLRMLVDGYGKIARAMPSLLKSYIDVFTNIRDIFTVAKLYDNIARAYFRASDLLNDANHKLAELENAIDMYNSGVAQVNSVVGATKLSTIKREIVNELKNMINYASDFVSMLAGLYAIEESYMNMLNRLRNEQYFTNIAPAVETFVYTINREAKKLASIAGKYDGDKGEVFIKTLEQLKEMYRNIKKEMIEYDTRYEDTFNKYEQGDTPLKAPDITAGYVSGVTKSFDQWVRDLMDYWRYGFDQWRNVSPVHALVAWTGLAGASALSQIASILPRNASRNIGFMAEGVRTLVTNPGAWFAGARKYLGEFWGYLTSDPLKASAEMAGAALMWAALISAGKIAIGKIGKALAGITSRVPARLVSFFRRHAVPLRYAGTVATDIAINFLQGDPIGTVISILQVPVTARGLRAGASSRAAEVDNVVSKTSLTVFKDVGENKFSAIFKTKVSNAVKPIKRIFEEAIKRANTDLDPKVAWRKFVDIASMYRGLDDVMQYNMKQITTQLHETANIAYKLRNVEVRLRNISTSLKSVFKDIDNIVRSKGYGSAVNFIKGVVQELKNVSDELRWLKTYIEKSDLPDAVKKNLMDRINDIESKLSEIKISTTKKLFDFDYFKKDLIKYASIIEEMKKRLDNIKREMRKASDASKLATQIGSELGSVLDNIASLFRSVNPEIASMAKSLADEIRKSGGDADVVVDVINRLYSSGLINKLADISSDILYAAKVNLDDVLKPLKKLDDVLKSVDKLASKLTTYQSKLALATMLRNKLEAVMARIDTEARRGQEIRASKTVPNVEIINALKEIRDILEKKGLKDKVKVVDKALDELAKTGTLSKETVQTILASMYELRLLPEVLLKKLVSGLKSLGDRIAEIVEAFRSKGVVISPEEASSLAVYAREVADAIRKRASELAGIGEEGVTRVVYDKLADLMMSIANDIDSGIVPVSKLSKLLSEIQGEEIIPASIKSKLMAFVNALRGVDDPEVRAVVDKAVEILRKVGEFDDSKWAVIRVEGATTELGAPKYLFLTPDEVENFIETFAKHKMSRIEIDGKEFFIERHGFVEPGKVGYRFRFYDTNNRLIGEGAVEVVIEGNKARIIRYIIIDPSVSQNVVTVLKKAVRSAEAESLPTKLAVFDVTKRAPVYVSTAVLPPIVMFKGNSLKLVGSVSVSTVGQVFGGGAIPPSGGRSMPSGEDVPVFVVESKGEKFVVVPEPIYSAVISRGLAPRFPAVVIPFSRLVVDEEYKNKLAAVLNELRRYGISIDFKPGISGIEIKVNEPNITGISFTPDIISLKEPGLEHGIDLGELQEEIQQELQKQEEEQQLEEPTEPGPPAVPPPSVYAPVAMPPRRLGEGTTGAKPRTSMRGRQREKLAII